MKQAEAVAASRSSSKQKQQQTSRCRSSDKQQCHSKDCDELMGTSSQSIPGSLFPFPLNQHQQVLA